MANEEEHLARLNKAIEMEDIEIWNKWRKENHDINPVLQEAIYVNTEKKLESLNSLKD
jgi:hypothetical protein